jgi:hypothetical protein
VWKFQKYTLIVLLLFIGVLVVVLGKCYENWNAKKIVSDEIIKEYGETYLRRYEHLLDNKVLSAYHKYFSFHKEKPFLIKATISNSHGGAVEFIPSKTQEFQCQTVTDRIEQEIFPHRDPNSFKIEFDTNNDTVLRNPGSGPLWKPGGKGNEIRNIISITNKGWFLDLLEEVSLATKAINVDGIDYPNTIIIKGSNRRSAWSRKVAKEDALHEFDIDFREAYWNSEEFREFVATPEITQIATEIIAKEKAGEYGGQYGYLKMKDDIVKLDNIADAHQIKHELTKNLLAFLKEQPSWREKHWLIFYLILTCIGALLIGFIKWSWRKLILSQRILVWWTKKKISNK